MLPQWSFNVDNDTTPLWFFCAQMGHCQMGMVFSVNADPDSAKSFAVYQANAKSAAAAAPGGASGAPDNNGDTAGASSNVTSGASSTAGVTTSAPASSLSSGSPTLSSSASNPSNSTSGGFRLERSTSLPVLTALGLASVLLL